MSTINAIINDMQLFLPPLLPPIFPTEEIALGGLKSEDFIISDKQIMNHINLLYYHTNLLYQKIEELKVFFNSRRV